jgi:hypothetical protein
MPSRYETPFQIMLNADQARHLTDNGQPRQRGQLFVRVLRDSVHARWPADGTFDNPPEYSARVQEQPDGILISGSIRESRSSMMWVWLWRIPTFLMLAVTVGAVVALIVPGDHDGLGGVVLGGIGSILFALMWRWQRSLRKPTFDSDARKLGDGVLRYLTTGDGGRHTF